MLKHTVSHRSSSSLSACSSNQPASLPYHLPSYQNEHSFQTRRGSLSSSVKYHHPMPCYSRRPLDSTHSSPMPSSKLQGKREWTTSEDPTSRKDSITSLSGDRKVLNRKISGSRSFVELINILDGHPNLVDMDQDDTCSEASFSSIDTYNSSLGSKTQFDNVSSCSSNSYLGHNTDPSRFVTLPRNNDLQKNGSLKNADSFSSIESCTSCSSLNSSGTLVNSKSSSTTTLSETIPVKVYIRKLRPDMEYKTLPLKSATTCREMILSLLVKFRLRHRDPNLFFVMMEMTVRSPSDSAPTRRILVLDDNARPAELQQCRPTGEARFSIGVRRGGLIRVHDSILMPGSQYKSLIICYGTTSDELVQLILKCYNNNENPKHFLLHEVCKNPYTDRPLKGEECPLLVQADWPKLDRSNRAFVLRRNIVYSFSLKSRIKWRQHLEQPDTDGQSELQNGRWCRVVSTPLSLSSTDTRKSCFSSSGSVSSSCSTSSDSSLDSGYLGSPLSSFKLPSSSSSAVVSKSSQMCATPHMPLQISQNMHPHSIPLTQSLSRLTRSLEKSTDISNPVTNQVKFPPISMQETDIKPNVQPKYVYTSQPIRKRNILVVNPINLKQLPAFSNTTAIESLSITERGGTTDNKYSTNQANIREHSTKPKIVGEIPKDTVLSKLRSQLSESLLSSNRSSNNENHLKLLKCPPPPPPSPRNIRNNFFSREEQYSSFPNAERKFYEAVESMKSLGSTKQYIPNVLKIVE